MSDILIRPLKTMPYQAAWDAMRAFTDARTAETPDEIWQIEHPPVYTQGIAGKPEHLLHATDIPVIRTDRGGKITYHAPGQLVLYPLIDLRRRKLGVRHMVRRMEDAVVTWLAGYGVTAYGKPDAPGVYVKIADVHGELPTFEAKIASLGLKVRNGCTYHGLSVNVSLDLTPFHNINVCGYPGLAVTRVADLIDNPPDVARAGSELAPILAALLSHE
jgi:lipoyl(octanoyl) transferase